MTELANHHAVIVLTGDLGPFEALDLRRRLNRQVGSRNSHVTLDLSHVVYVHPAAAAVISGASRRARKGKGLLSIVAPLAPAVQRSLGLLAPLDLSTRP